jgi:hypothetical protein
VSRTPALTACLIAMLALYAGRIGSADAPATGRQGQNPPPPRSAELDPAKQKYIWDMEHAAFVLETYFGKPLVESLVQGQRESLQAWFREDFQGQVLAGSEPERRQACQVAEVRRDVEKVSQERVDAAGFARYLLGYLAGFERVESARLQVMFIDRTDEANGRHHTTLRLTAIGTAARGRLIEHESHHEVDFRFQDTEEVKQRSRIVERARVLFETRRTGERSLMEEVTEQVGLADLPLLDNWKLNVKRTRNHRYQLAVEDFDRDGYPDIALASTDGRPWLLRSARGASFQDVTAATGLPTGEIEGENNIRALVAWLDYDNDGFPDLLLGDRLYHNVGGRRFSDVSAASGLSFDRSPFGAAVADFDADGRLDLYIFYQRGFRQSSPRKRPWVGDPDAGTENHLWHNEGGGRFRNVTAQAGAAGGRHQTFAASTFFLDDDRFPDLYLANDFGTNVLLRNRGDGSFEDVTRRSGAGDFATSMGVTAGDLDNDGVTELYVANMYSKMGRRIVAHVSEEDYLPGLYQLIRGSLAGNRLYRRDARQSRFHELSDGLGINAVGWAYAPAMVDLDGDGWLDLYAATGFLSYDREKPDG